MYIHNAPTLYHRFMDSYRKTNVGIIPILFSFCYEYMIFPSG